MNLRPPSVRPMSKVSPASGVEEPSLPSRLTETSVPAAAGSGAADSASMMVSRAPTCGGRAARSAVARGEVSAEGAMVAASAAPLLTLLTGARAGVASGCCGARGSPAGGVGPTAAMVCITPNTAAAGCCGCGGDGAGATGIGADTAGGADGCVAGPGCCKRCPQCWQNEKPAGVCLPHDGHVTFPVDGDALAGADGAAASGAFAASEVP